MNTTNNRKKSVIAAVGAAVAAAAVPAFLFAGAGTAQAMTGVKLIPDADNEGVTVRVVSVCLPLLGPEGPVDSPASHAMCEGNISWGDCYYTAIPQTFGPVPVFDHKFWLPKAGKTDLHFDAKQTGAKWDVTIKCPNNGTDSATQQVVY